MTYRPGSFRFLILLAALPVLSAPAPAQHPTTSSATLAPGLTLLLETAPFLPAEHEIRNDAATGLVVDGCEAFFGTDNMMPGTYLREARVRLEGQWHALDASCMYACEACTFDAADVAATPNPGGVGYRLEGRFSDGAGTYYATWLVTPTGTARTGIVDGPAAARHALLPGDLNDGRSAERWQCRNDVEIRCTAETCEAAPEGEFTPMHVTVDDAGWMSVCAYSGCWEGTGTVVKSDDFLILTGDELPFSTAPDAAERHERIAVTIDRADGVGILKAGAFAHPVRCEQDAGE